MFSARCLVLVGLGVFVWMGGPRGPDDAAAQQVYRSIGADGRVTFSDRVPLEPGSRAATAPTVAVAPAGGSDVAALPFELRQAASSYPVTLFSGPECAPCVQGRAMLSTRGIPFAEKTISTNEDIDALKRLVGVATLPVLTIGAQQLKGYSELEWTQFLDAAGYPKTSQLPAGYHRPAAAPLVAAHEAKPPLRQAPSASAAPATSTPLPTPPEGSFRF